MENPRRQSCPFPRPQGTLPAPILRTRPPGPDPQNWINRTRRSEVRRHRFRAGAGRVRERSARHLPRRRLWRRWVAIVATTAVVVVIIKDPRRRKREPAIAATTTIAVTVTVWRVGTGVPPTVTHPKTRPRTTCPPPRRSLRVFGKRRRKRGRIGSSLWRVVDGGIRLVGSHTAK